MKLRRSSLLLLAAWIAIGAAGCLALVSDFPEGEPGEDGGLSEATGDSGVEEPADGGAQGDGGPNAGADAGANSGTDAGGNAGVDAGADAGVDAGTGTAVDSGVLDAGPSSSRHTARPLGSTTAPRGFYEYLPPAYSDGELRPLLVFLHGIGENGNGTTELSRVLANGPPKLIAGNAWPSSRPFVVLSPQHSGGGCPSAAEVQGFIAWAAANYRVDPKQLFLTALSCGAIGSWSYLGANTDAHIAASVLICGDPGNPINASSAWGKAGCNLGSVAIWAFHGDADTVVNINNAADTMTRLLACPSPPRRDAVWTVFPGGSHNVWAGVYNGSAGHDIYSWLLAHPKP